MIFEIWANNPTFLIGDGRCFCRDGMSLKITKKVDGLFMKDKNT